MRSVHTDPRVRTSQSHYRFAEPDHGRGAARRVGKLLRRLADHLDPGSPSTLVSIPELLGARDPIEGPCSWGSSGYWRLLCDWEEDR